MSLGISMGIDNITGVASVLANGGEGIIMDVGNGKGLNRESSFNKIQWWRPERSDSYTSQKKWVSRKLQAVFVKNGFISGRFRIDIHLVGMENEQKIAKIEKANGQTLPDDFKV